MNKDIKCCEMSSDTNMDLMNDFNGTKTKKMKQYIIPTLA